MNGPWQATRPAVSAHEGPQSAATGASPPRAALGSPELRGLLAGIRAGAADRERADQSPVDQLADIMHAGLGSLSLPVVNGGQGASVRQLLSFVIDLAEADPIVAHILRTHYHQVLSFLRLPEGADRRRWLEVVRSGLVFGNAVSETGPVSAGNHDFATTLTQIDGRLVLEGTKYYSTGTLYADRITVAARLPGDQVATIVVPADRAGVHVIDDWDGMGQRRTGTGTTSFTDVTVEPDEIVARRPRLAPRPPGDAAFVQLYLHAIIAGILRSVVTDATTLVRDRRRSFDHAPTPHPVDDPILQQRVGELAATAWAAEAAVLAAAVPIEAALQDSDTGTTDLAAAASWAASAAKVHLDRAALDAATALFDLGGASASSRSRNLDRHWRNIRTITLHNPASYKAAALGRSLITGEPLPTNGYF